MRRQLLLLLAVIFFAVGWRAAGQTILGRHPADTATDQFWLQNNNADTAIMGFNRYHTVSFTNNAYPFLYSVTPDGQVISFDGNIFSNRTAGTALLVLRAGGLGIGTDVLGGNGLKVAGNVDSSTGFSINGTPVGTGGGSTVIISNTVFVSKGGNDSTAQRCRLDLTFLTCAAAVSAANAGDTVYVWPGAYEGTNLLKNGVNWKLSDNATLTSNSGIFDDHLAGAVTSNIDGGKFTVANSIGVINTTNAKTVLNISGIFASNTVAEVVKVTNGVVTISGRLYGSTAKAVAWTSASDKLFFRDATLIAGAGQYAINTPSSVNIGLLGNLRSNTNSSPNTGFSPAGIFIVDSTLQ